MLYRHFPKIANKVFSILTISLAGNSDPEHTERLLLRAAEQGINLVYTGSDTARIRAVGTLLEKNGLRETIFRIVEFRGETAEELETFVANAGESAENFLLIHLADTNAVSRFREAGVFAAAGKLKSSGAISHCGFSVPCDPAVISAALESHTDWDFWATSFNYLHYNITESLSSASEAELALLAFDPFESGRLENLPADIHELFRNAPVPRSRDEWALRSIWEKQEVTSVVWEPSSPEDILQKTILAEAGRPNSLPERELAVLEAAAALAGKENLKNY